VKKFAIEPRDGFAVNLCCSISLNPSSDEVASLAKLVQDEARISIEGPPDLFDAAPPAPTPAPANGSLPLEPNRDALYAQAEALVRKENRASISLVQRTAVHWLQPRLPAHGAAAGRRCRFPHGRDRQAPGQAHSHYRSTAMNQPKESRRHLRGFAVMDPARQREIAQLGGLAAHREGRAHQWTSEEAREAGRKGAAAKKANRAATGA
jgi:general stress protein YciG